MPRVSASLNTVIEEIWLDLTGGNSPSQLTRDFTYQGPLVTEFPTLKVVIENMLSNALRYADTKKPSHIICVKSEPDDCGVKISFTDNGIGISKGNIPKVFKCSDGWVTAVVMG